MKCPPNRAPLAPERVPAAVAAPGFYQSQPIVSVPAQGLQGGYAGIEGTDPVRTTQLYCIGTMDACFRDRNETLRPLSDMMNEYRGKAPSYNSQKSKFAMDPLDPFSVDIAMREGLDPDRRFKPNADFSQRPLPITTFGGF